MRHRLLSLGLQLLHRIVQEKIYEYSVDLGLRVLALDLAPDELDAPDSAAYIARPSVRPSVRQPVGRSVSQPASQPAKNAVDGEGVGVRDGGRDLPSPPPSSSH